MSTTGPGRLAGPVDNRQAPDYPEFQKRVLRMVDIATVAPGTEITFGRTADISLYSDYPIEVRLREANKVYNRVRELHLSGTITGFWLRRYGNIPGRVTIYQSTPARGVKIEKESLRAAMTVTDQTGVAWISPNILSLVRTIAIPDVYWSEAVYLRSFHAIRTGGGTINEMYFVESETGVTLRLCDFREVAPGDAMERVFEEPIRISSSGSFYLGGSAEPVDTAAVLMLNWIPL
jgi:hypothetical protein